MKKRSLQVMATLTSLLLVQVAAWSCVFIFHQPKLPEGLDEFASSR